MCTSENYLYFSLQTFNVGEQNSSPVYSLDFNETSLFVALEKEVKILNFS